MRVRSSRGRILSACLGLASLAGTGLWQAQAEEAITQAQPPLPTVPLTITTQGGQSRHFTVELARTPREQETGEMFRRHIPADRGMLFIWPAPQDCAMWMRNTFISLDILFIDDENRIHAIEEHTVPLSEGIISSHGPVRSVLELPAGTAERLGILVGDQVSTSALSTPPGGSR